MAQYNPSDPCTVGMEWFTSQRGITLLDSNPKAVGMRLHAETTDEIFQFWTFLQKAFGGYSVMVLEVFDITSGLPDLDPTDTADYLPDSDRYVAPSPWQPGAFRGGGQYAADFWDSLNTTTLTPSTWPNSGQAVANDEFVFNYFGYGYDFSVGFAGVSGTQTGRWVTRVRSWANCAQYLALGAAGAFQIQPFIGYGADRRFGPAQAVDNAQGAVPVFQDWYFNPITGAPWTATDIDKFDSGYGGSDAMGMGWVVQPTGSSNNLATILQAKMVVESAPTDQRLAIGSTILAPQDATPNGTIGWQGITLRDPGDWSTPTSITLAPGNDYLFLLRRGNELDALAPSYIRGVDNEMMGGEPGWSSHYPTIDQKTLRPTALNDEKADVYASILLEGAIFPGGTTSLDSQVYATSWPPVTGLVEIPEIDAYYRGVEISAGTTASGGLGAMNQEFTATASADYQWFFVCCAQMTNEVDAPLRIGIYDNTTDALLGEAEITTADLTASFTSWQRVGVRVAVDIPLVSGTKYYFGIYSDTPRDKAWFVQLVYTGTGNKTPQAPPHLATSTSAASYGIDVDFLRVSAPSLVTGTIHRQTGMAAEVTISQIPMPVIGLTATASAETCYVSHIDLTWSTTIDVVCGTFDHFEIQRRDTPTSDWLTIAEITDPLVGYMTDYESRRNVEASYRIRLVRTDRVPSDWSATVSATATMTGAMGLIFTSNADPTLTVFYTDLVSGQTRDYNFPRNFSLFQPQGANGQVAYTEIPDRYVSFSRKLRIRAGAVPCLPECDNPDDYGADVFGPLVEITRAGIPYVCIHEESGQRWFAFVNTPAGQWTQHGSPEREGGWAVYTMDAQIIEETRVPAPIDVTLAAGS